MRRAGRAPASARFGTPPVSRRALVCEPTSLALGSGAGSYRVGAEATDNVTVSYTNMQAAAIGSGGANDIADLVTDNHSVSTTTMKANTLLTSNRCGDRASFDPARQARCGAEPDGVGDQLTRRLR